MHQGYGLNTKNASLDCSIMQSALSNVQVPHLDPGMTVKQSTVTRVIDINSQTDGPPDKIYDMYDTLQEGTETAKSIISSISHEDASWLARHIRERTVQGRDEVSKEVELELEVWDLGCRNSVGCLYNVSQSVHRAT